MFRIAALLLLLLISQTAGATAFPLDQRYTASYALSRNGLAVAESLRQLEPAGDGTYVLESVARPVGLVALFVRDTIVERSRWLYNGKAVHPLEYSYHQTGGRRERHIELRFDWEEATISDPEGLPLWELAPATQDIASIQFAIMLDLHRGKREFEYTVADGRRLRTYRFEVMGEESVRTPAGRFDTIRVQRVDNGDADTAMTFWCAPQLGYIPVRIEREDDRDRLTLQLLEMRDRATP